MLTRRRLGIALVAATIVIGVAVMAYLQSSRNRPVTLEQAGPSAGATTEGSSTSVPTNHARQQQIPEGSTSSGLTPSELNSLRKDAEFAESRKLAAQRLLDGMKLTKQPEGYGNRQVRESPDGRFAAFLATKGDTSNVVVLDRRLGTESVLPAPKENVFEARSIRDIQWAADGSELYVIEDATNGPRTRAELRGMSEDRRLDELNHVYWVLYAWSPGGGDTRVIGSLSDRPLAVAASSEGLLRVITESRAKGWGHVAVTTFKNERLDSTTTLPITSGGQNIEYDFLQLLPINNELWFITRLLDEKKQITRFSALAVMDLNAATPEARVVIPNVDDFAWSADENTLVIRKSTLATYSLYRITRAGTLQEPVLIAGNVKIAGSSFDLLGLSRDGRLLYLQGIASADGERETVGLSDRVRIYEYGIR